MIPLTLAALGWAARSIVHGVQAPDRIGRAYRDERARVRSTIEADHVLPNLRELTKEVLRGMGIESDDGAIEESLQSVDHLARLRTLSDLYGDHGATRTLLDNIERWSRRRAMWSPLFLVPFLYVVAAIGISPFPLPSTYTFVAGAVAIVGATIAITCWFQESSYRNRFADLCRRYE